MFELQPKYLTKLNDIKVSIQHSDELAKYLDEEEDEYYESLKEKFEGDIDEVYQEVAHYSPLQIIAFEEELLHPEYEGLFLHRILGYSVLRGRISEDAKFVKPQEHFKKVLLAICNSPNFTALKKRMGMSIETGFALSSEIWITNLLNEIDNKKVKTYLKSLINQKYIDYRSRITGRLKYEKQFNKFNYQTASLPETCADITIDDQAIIDFLKYRADSEFNNDNINPYISKLINGPFEDCQGYLKILLIIGLNFSLSDQDKKAFVDKWQTIRKKEGFDKYVFGQLTNLFEERNAHLLSEKLDRLYSTLENKMDGFFYKYLATVSEINKLGYINEDAANVVKDYYFSHRGTSEENHAMRLYILNNFKSFLNSLQEDDFHEYFELNPHFVNYMNIFDNEQFNQDLKTEVLKYIKKCLLKFDDKRSKNYQEIKKFVQISFADMGFMTEKQIKELFKRKAKKKD